MKDPAALFAELRRLMWPFARQLDLDVDEAGELSVNTRHVQDNGKPLWFGGVQIKKRYVSYHLMPVYVNTGLLDGVSPVLKKRMQGKSCFNFTSIDRDLFEELGELTRAGFEDFQRRGFVSSLVRPFTTGPAPTAS